MGRRSIRNPHPGSRPRRDAGLALVVALFTMALLLLAVASALLVGASNTRATRNYRGALRVHFVAESAIAEALQAINAVGVVNFQTDVVAPWATFGLTAEAFGPAPDFRYGVTPVASAADPSGTGRLCATATGPEGVRNVVVASVVRSNIPASSPGAIFLATDAPAHTTFNGNAFLIDGTDRNYTGDAGPSPPLPGLATRTALNTRETIDSLSPEQRDNLQGTAYASGPPVVPSILTSPAAPSIPQMDQIITDLLARPGMVTVSAAQLTGQATFGTPAAPQITHFASAGGVTIKGNGTASGAGIMIVEGDLTIQGSFDFKGLVIVRGRTNVENDPSQTQVTGNATLYGSLWTQDLNFVVGGSAIIQYSSQALQLANQAGGGRALPSPLVVTALLDCAQLAPGASGCP